MIPISAKYTVWVRNSINSETELLFVLVLASSRIWGDSRCAVQTVIELEVGVDVGVPHFHEKKVAALVECRSWTELKQGVGVPRAFSV